VDDLLTLDDFAPAVGEAFAVHVEGADGLELELVEARPLGMAPTEREPFALLFRGPADPLLPQAIYRLASDRVGEQDIFIVPVGRDERGTEYEAIFT
jgi:hypothetical protein